MDDNSTDGLSISGENSDWDDTDLIKAYDRAILSSKKIVAQRLKTQANEKTKPGKKQPSFHKGSHCRAIYDVDEVEYEAVVDSDDGEFVTVTFLGYRNQQRVKKNELKNSWGRKERARQIEQASFTDVGGDIPQEIEDEKPIIQNLNGPMANMMVPPPAPFPPHIMKKMNTKEKDALNAMLMSWYMSGYYTGYYQAIQNT